MTFNCCDCGDRHKTIFTARQLQNGVLSWWKRVVINIQKHKSSKMSWEDFLVQLKREYYSEKDLEK